MRDECDQDFEVAAEAATPTDEGENFEEEEEEKGARRPQSSMCRETKHVEGGCAISGGDLVQIELSEDKAFADSKETYPAANHADGVSLLAGLKPPRISAKSISTDGSEGRDLPEYCDGDTEPAAQSIAEDGSVIERSRSSMRNETVSTFLKSLVMSGPGNEVFDAPVKVGSCSSKES